MVLEVVLKLALEVAAEELVRVRASAMGDASGLANRAKSDTLEVECGVDIEVECGGVTRVTRLRGVEAPNGVDATLDFLEAGAWRDTMNDDHEL